MQLSRVGYLCTCARAHRVANCAKIWCAARDPIVTRFTRVGGGVTTFARACPVSLSRKPLSPGIEATSKTDLSLSRSLVHRQTWRLTGSYVQQLWNKLTFQGFIHKNMSLRILGKNLNQNLLLSMKIIQCQNLTFWPINPRLTGGGRGLNTSP